MNKWNFVKSSMLVILVGLNCFGADEAQECCESKTTEWIPVSTLINRSESVKSRRFWRKVSTNNTLQKPHCELRVQNGHKTFLGEVCGFPSDIQLLVFHYLRKAIKIQSISVGLPHGGIQRYKEAVPAHLAQEVVVISGKDKAGRLHGVVNQKSDVKVSSSFSSIFYSILAIDQEEISKAMESGFFGVPGSAEEFLRK